MSAGDSLSPRQFMTHDSLNARLHAELDFDPSHLDPPQIPHPKSGWPLDVGIKRQVARPPEGHQEGPAVFQVQEHSHENYLPKDLGTEPIQHVYRGMSMDEWHEAQQRGTIHSDGRGTLAHWEGTNAAVNPETAAYYLPYGSQGVVAKIRVRPEHEWYTIQEDQYLRTRKPVPIEDAVRVTRPLTKDEHGAVLDDRRKPRP